MPKDKSRKTQTIRNVGKGGQNEILPSRFARDNFTGADPLSRTMNNYAKKSPYRAMADEMGIGDKPMMRR